MRVSISHNDGQISLRFQSFDSFGDIVLHELFHVSINLLVIGFQHFVGALKVHFVVVLLRSKARSYSVGDGSESKWGFHGERIVQLRQRHRTSDFNAFISLLEDR